jgi:hypothetical protein
MEFTTEKYTPTLLAALITGGAAFQNGAGFFLAVGLFFALPLIFTQMIFGLFKGNCKHHAVKLCIWGVIAVPIGFKHHYIHLKHREMANLVVDRTKEYKEIHSVYPASLLEIGFTYHPATLKDIPIRYGAKSDNEPPLIFYPTEFSSFQSFSFYFDENKWRVIGG